MELYDNQMKIDNLKTIELFTNKIIDKGERVLNEISTIELIDVSFMYPGTKEYVVKNINIKLTKAE